jgi:hypothetical protein
LYVSRIKRAAKNRYVDLIDSKQYPKSHFLHS